MSDVEIILRKVLTKIIEKLQYKNEKILVKELTSGGANYTSALFYVDVTSPDEDTLKLFAKVANVSGVFRKIMNIDYKFKTEQFVYSHLVKVYDNIQDEHNLIAEQRFEFPKFFGGESAEGEETVVIEDLTVKGYGIYSRFKSIDWEHAASAMEYLARFHALSFAYQKADPENFAKDVQFVKAKEHGKEKTALMSETWKKMIASAINVTKEEHKERLARLLADE